jgi:hypothetical protein
MSAIVIDTNKQSGSPNRNADFMCSGSVLLGNAMVVDRGANAAVLNAANRLDAASAVDVR